MKVVHVTSVHSRRDVRIFVKQCRSLAKRYDVSLVVADGLPNETVDDVKIFGVSGSSNRAVRVLTSWFFAGRQAIRLDGDIYHLHDPEMIFLGLYLKAKGKKVIFDAHENLPKAILSKEYIPKFARPSISWFVAILERFALSKFTGVIAATPAIARDMKHLNRNMRTVNNYPLGSEILRSPLRKLSPENRIGYVGGITSVRGMAQLVEATSLAKHDVRLMLAGPVSPPRFEAVLATCPGWENVELLGVLTRGEVKELLITCHACVVTFLPEPNHVESQPNKIFEYMSSAVPVIASDFELWKRLVETESCGICVDPKSPKKIAAAIDWIIENPVLSEGMGRNGLEAVKRKFNWDTENLELLSFYEDALST